MPDLGEPFTDAERGLMDGPEDDLRWSPAQVRSEAAPVGVLSAASDVTCGCRGWLRVAGTKVFVLCANRPMNGEKSSPKHPAVKDVVMP